MTPAMCQCQFLHNPYNCFLSPFYISKICQKHFYCCCSCQHFRFDFRLHYRFSLDFYGFQSLLSSLYTQMYWANTFFIKSVGHIKWYLVVVLCFFLLLGKKKKQFMHLFVVSSRGSRAAQSPVGRSRVSAVSKPLWWVMSASQRDFLCVARHCHFLNYHCIVFYFILWLQQFVFTPVTSCGVVAKCRQRYLLSWEANCCAVGQTITTLEVQIMYNVRAYKSTTDSYAILKKNNFREGHICFFNMCSKSRWDISTARWKQTASQGSARTD